MRVLILLVGLLTVGIVACGGDAAKSENNLPVMYAMTYIQNQDTPNQIEPRGVMAPGTGVQDCLIPASLQRYLTGTCEWEIAGMSDGGWSAKYMETWKCADYNAIAGNSDFCTAEKGSHEWDYQISPDGSTKLVVQSGDPPPEGLGAGAPKP